MTRSVLALGAAGLTAAATVISQLNGDSMELGFFAALTLAALVAAGALVPAAGDRGHLVAAMIAAAWKTGGVWIGVLLVQFVVACGCLRPVEPPEATYLGLTATTYHLVAMYAANALLLVAAFGRSKILDRPVGRSGNLG